MLFSYTGQKLDFGREESNEYTQNSQFGKSSISMRCTVVVYGCAHIVCYAETVSLKPVWCVACAYVYVYVYERASVSVSVV